MSLVIEFFAEIIFEFGVKGLGYTILRYVFQVGQKKELDPDGWPVIVTGILAWVLNNYYSHYHMEAIFWTELANPPLEPMSSTAFLSNFVNNGSAA